MDLTFDGELGVHSAWTKVSVVTGIVTVRETW
jgi:hypothetical protein